MMPYNKSSRAASPMFPQPRLAGRYRRTATNDHEALTLQTPCLVSDGAEGKLLIIEGLTICTACGGTARTRSAYACNQSDLAGLGERFGYTVEFGDQVRHYFTRCMDCGEEGQG